MEQRLRDLRNIGPQTERWLHEAGIHTPNELEALGAMEAWRRVRALRPDASLVGLYAVQGALINCHWNELPEEMRDELRAAFEEALR